MRLAQPVEEDWEFTFDIPGVSSAHAKKLFDDMCDTVEEALGIEKVWTGGMAPRIEIGDEDYGPTDDELAVIVRELEGSDPVRSTTKERDGRT